MTLKDVIEKAKKEYGADVKIVAGEQGDMTLFEFENGLIGKVRLDTDDPFAKDEDTYYYSVVDPVNGKKYGWSLPLGDGTNYAKTELDGMTHEHLIRHLKDTSELITE